VVFASKARSDWHSCRRGNPTRSWPAISTNRHSAACSTASSGAAKLPHCWPREKHAQSPRDWFRGPARAVADQRIDCRLGSSWRLLLQADGSCVVVRARQAADASLGVAHEASYARSCFARERTRCYTSNRRGGTAAHGWAFRWFPRRLSRCHWQCRQRTQSVRLSQLRNRHLSCSKRIAVDHFVILGLPSAASVAVFCVRPAGLPRALVTFDAFSSSEAGVHPRIQVGRDRAFLRQRYWMRGSHVHPSRATGLARNGEV